MATGGRSGVLVAASARRELAWAPDWRAALAGALAREVEERRFFLWIPVAAMAGVALNFAADSEPVLWLPALMAAIQLTTVLMTGAPPGNENMIWLRLLVGFDIIFTILGVGLVETVLIG